MSKRFTSTPDKDQRGFTLVEILVSLVILLILVVAFVPMFTFVAQAVSNNTAKDAATALANQTIEDLRSLPFIVRDPESGLIEESPDVPQLGLKNGDPPGSVEPEKKQTINGKEFTIITDIKWDDTMYYKEISVSVEYPSAFNNNRVVSKFYTAAAEEGDLDLPDAGYIKVKVLNHLGEPFLDEAISVKVEPYATGQSTLSENTEDGESLFGLIKVGSYRVSAYAGDKAYSPEQTMVDGWLIQEDIEVLNKDITEVHFFIDYPARISLQLKDNNNNAIKGNGIIELSWTNGINAKVFDPVAFTANNFTGDSLPASHLGDLWPGGNYSLKLKDVLDSTSLRAYKEYDMSNNETPRPRLNGSDWAGTLTANETASLKVEYFTVANSLLKTHLILDPELINNLSLGAGYVEFDQTTKHVTKWLDQSGKNNHATAAANVAQQPVIGGNPELKRTWINFDRTNHQILAIDTDSICKDTFTVFIMAKPDGTQTITQPDEPSDTGITGTSGQHYVFWPEHGGNLNGGQGLSLGINGVSNYEHGDSYLPATALFKGNMQPWRVIGVRYENKLPFLYVNSVLQVNGLPSLRPGNIISPTIIGGPGTDAWGVNPCYSGYVAAVLIYDTALNDTNMKFVNDSLRSRFALEEGVN